MKNQRYFVTGIGTGIGKTLISAILTEYLQADYWKPIQSGDLDKSDSLFIAKHISNSKSKIHPESYRFKNPLSPHAAAKLENTTISLDKIQLPSTENSLIIEGAGGLYVPLNQDDFIIDLIKKLEVPVILVSQIYLGSINHSLLSIAALKQYQIPIAGIIFNGDRNPETESIIEKHSQIPILGHIPILRLNQAAEIKQASQFLNWKP